jgi:hypothetical protein
MKVVKISLGTLKKIHINEIKSNQILLSENRKIVNIFLPV